MSNVIIDDTNLANIAQAIREKNNTSQTYKPREMAQAISEIKQPPENAFEFSGDLKGAFSKFGWFIDEYGEKITTKNITDMEGAFSECDAHSIPFTINLSDSNSAYRWCSAFRNMYNVEYIAPIPVLKADNIVSYLFADCHNLVELPQVEVLDLSKYQKGTYSAATQLFYNCYSLRSIPEQWMKQLYNKGERAYKTDVGRFATYDMCYNCLCLDELTNLIPSGGNVEKFEVTKSMMTNIVLYCYRLKNFTFALQEDNSPYKVNWTNQSIFFTKAGWEEIWYGSYSAPTVGKASGITEETRITDEESYQRLKNHPDSWTTQREYSRYNHDSAVRTINSLPDTSEYLETAGGSNTICFKGDAGSLTDGGAINTLTEEEIAVAAAKGWTITYS